MMKKDTKAEKGNFTEFQYQKPLKKNKMLFRPLIEKPATPKLTSTTTLAIEDLVDRHEDIKQEWEGLIEGFDGIRKYDYKSLMNYNSANEDKIDNLCTKSSKFFSNIIAKYSSEAANLSGKGIKEDLAKIYVVTFQRITDSLVDMLCPPLMGESGKVDVSKIDSFMSQRAVMNDFMLLMLQDRRNHSFLYQHDNTILQIIRKSVGSMQERLSHSQQILYKEKTIYFFYYHFQAIAMLAAYNENKKFMKNAAFDGLKLAFEIVDRSLGMSLGSFLFQELYDVPFAGDEEWIQSQDLLISRKYGKKKFSFIHINNEPSAGPSTKCLFSLRYINLYYVFKIAQLLIERSKFVFEERTVETFSSILKRNTGALSEIMTSTGLKEGNESPSKHKQSISSLLNENLICLKLLKYVVSIFDDPLGLLEKLGINNYLKSLLHNHVVVVLMKGLISPPEKLDRVQDFSYKTTRGYIGGIFRFVSELKYLGFKNAPKTAGKTYKTPFAVFSDELMFDILAFGEEKLDLIQPGLPVFKAFLSEYVCDTKNILSPQLGEHILRLIGSKLFNFTAPINLKMLEKKEEEKSIIESLDILTTLKLIEILNKIIMFDKSWAKSVLDYFFLKIKEFSNSEEKVFALYKLIFSGINNKTYSNEEFYDTLLKKQPKQLNMEIISKYDAEIEQGILNKVIVAFNDIKGIQELILGLVVAYEKLPSDENNNVKTSILLAEKMLMHLHSCPPLCDFLLSAQKPIECLLEIAETVPSCREFIVFVLQQLLLIIRYSKFQQGAVNDAYLPYVLLNYSANSLLNKAKESSTMSICIYDLVLGFLASEENNFSLSYHQIIMFQKQTLPLAYALTENIK